MTGRSWAVTPAPRPQDVDEKLLKEGFTETDQSEDGSDFAEEGWPDIKYSYKVEQVELPSFDQLQAIASGAAAGSAAGGSGARGSGSGSDGESGAFEDSALGGILSMLGGGFSGGDQGADSRAGASFIQTYYQIVQEALKASVRKVTLVVKYDVFGQENEIKTVAFFTDASGLDKGLLGGLPQDQGSGSGSGSSGSGSGSSGGGSKPPTTTTGGGR